MARHSPVRNLCRTITDHQGVFDKRSASLTRTFPRKTECPPRAQAGGKFAFQSAAPLDVECLINCFVTDAHALILWEIHLQPLRDLFRAPCKGPASTLTMNCPSLFPYHERPFQCDTIRRGDQACKAIVDIIVQGRILCQLTHFGTLGRTIRMPLRCNGTIIEIPAPGRRIAPDLTRYRAGRTSQLAGNSTHPGLACAFQGDFFTLGKRKTTALWARGRRG
ncbi:hypothetical protein S101446_03278 (plasmid) [Komagataeibacter europaeus]|nr:hypothetical protein S101446_03278 [Komagataeibacter europaeus]